MAVPRQDLEALLQELMTEKGEAMREDSVKARQKTAIDKGENDRLMGSNGILWWFNRI